MQPYTKFLALILVISSPIAKALPPADINKDHWVGTGLKVQDFITHAVPDCNKDGLHILGCVEALNVMASYLNPPQRFATVNEKKVDSSLGIQIATYGGLGLYQINIDDKPQDKEDFVRILEQEKKLMKVHSEELQALSASGSPIDFKAIFLDITAKAMGTELKDHVERLTAQLFNSYLAIVKDPHTMLWSRAEVEEEYQGESDSFVGIGVTLGVLNNEVYITSDMPGGPALEAGLKIGDVFVSIDGKPTAGKSTDEVANWVRGPEGQVVELVMRRKNENVTFKVTRRKIEKKNVETSIVKDNGIPYGYIRLDSFMDKQAAGKIANAVLKFQTTDHVKGYIIDLRNNGGGLLNQAIIIGSVFMGRQKIVGVKSLATGEMQMMEGPFNAIDPSTPMVVLVNGLSASASEILAGAIQDNRRGWIVGDRTYGKATVQGPNEDPEFDNIFSGNKNVELYSTIARFYQPTGRTNQIVGIIPDFQVDPVPNATEIEKYSPREEDNYMALPPVGTPWSQPRPDEVEAINACREERAAKGISAIEHFNSIKEQETVVPDYRLLVAEDILSCSSK